MFRLINSHLEKSLLEKNQQNLVSIIGLTTLIIVVIVFHVIYCSLYIYSNTYELAFMNFSTGIVNILALYFILYKDKILIAMYIFILSIIYYSLYCTYFLGYEINSIILLPVLTVGLYTIYEFDKKHLTIIGMLLFITYLFLLYIRFNITPKYNYKDKFLYIEISNVLIAFFCSYFVLYLKQISNVYLSKLNNEKIKNLTTKANKDFLTGLWNRRYLENEFENKNISNNYYVVIADIDFFKNINDTYGHYGGDLILQNISKIFVDYFDKKQIICRWGGEEFIFILQNIDAKYIYNLLEKLRIDLSNTPFVYNNHAIWLTISFGVSYADKNTTFDVATRQADEALYFSKNNGRNKITFFNDLNKIN